MKRLEKAQVISLRKELDLWEYLEKVMPVVREIKERGLEALRKYVRKFDNYEGCLEFSQEDIGRLSKPELVDIFSKVLDHLERFSKRFIPNNVYIREGGVEGWTLWSPIKLLGAYVPGGLYPYPSTVLMTAG